nr:immunoglobulin light chain junction region [Macaca mulatta]MOX69696.1 immunoglobulin light chain junction region [Macaca mulatta]MOX70105.1 immunoglobulin light chain junction region [Macaca mulatta]MOX71810.1 immunoglobulin light chain junction region [Macaca mulatta]MOX72540.1 immunoglobulin light chain junction region [Macaca mulatta]
DYYCMIWHDNAYWIF